MSTLTFKPFGLQLLSESSNFTYIPYSEISHFSFDLRSQNFEGCGAITIFLKIGAKVTHETTPIQKINTFNEAKRLMQILEDVKYYGLVSLNNT